MVNPRDIAVNTEEEEEEEFMTIFESKEYNRFFKDSIEKWVIMFKTFT